MGRRPRRRNWTLRLLNRTSILKVLIDLAPGYAASVRELVGEDAQRHGRAAADAGRCRRRLPPLLLLFPLLLFLELPATEGKGSTTGFVAAAPRYLPAASAAKPAGGARGEENPATAPWPRRAGPP